MNFIAKLALPAALALAAFGAQAEGFTPSAGGVYTGPIAQSVLPSVETAMRITPFVPVGGGVFMDTVASPVGSVSPTGAMSVAQPAASFLGA